RQTCQEISEQNKHDMTDTERDTIDSKHHQETPEQDEHDMTSSF
ncbi:15431_t:CDS:1, partial [Funneliformis caledonium]